MPAARDALARLGGDEFAILLTRLSDEQQANAIAFRIQEALSTPFSIGGREVFSTASIGSRQGGRSTPTQTTSCATPTPPCTTRRRAGRRDTSSSTRTCTRAPCDRLGLENDLRHAVINKDFDVHYQPIVSLASGMAVGFESLVRWTRNGEPVSPATFIPMAEELGLIEPIGTWVLKRPAVVRRLAATVS